VAGDRRQGPDRGLVIIDMDATLVTASSEKKGSRSHLAEGLRLPPDPPDEPGREMAWRAALDRAAGEAHPPPDAEPDRLGEEDGLALQHHLHEHPGQRHHGRPRQPPPPVHRRGPPRARRRGDRRRPDRQGHGPAQPPSKTWQVNIGWVIAANTAADLAGWTRLLGCHDDDGLRDADPGTLRYRIARHARQRTLAISPDWPSKEAFLTCWHRLCALPAPA
jgi:hypothetical protein